MSMVDAMIYNLFGESSEEGDPKVPDLIERAVKILEDKGYDVKYASPGYVDTRFSNDRDKDGIINGKHATTGRIIFARDYSFNETPKFWEWKVLGNKSKALYVKPYSYSGPQGKEDENFKKWQAAYIDSVTSWAKGLPKVGDKE